MSAWWCTEEARLPANAGVNEYGLVLADKGGDTGNGDNGGRSQMCCRAPIPRSVMRTQPDKSNEVNENPDMSDNQLSHTRPHEARFNE